MAFTTRTYSGIAEDTTGPGTCTGTFSAHVFADANGSPSSGTWSYSGSYHPLNSDLLPDGYFSFSGTITTSPSSTSAGVFNVDLVTSDTQFTGFAVLSEEGGVWTLTVVPSFTLGIPDPRGGAFIFLEGFSTVAEFTGPASPPPVVSIDSYTSSVTEGEGGTVSVRLTRSGADLSRESTVQLVAEDGSAVSSGVYVDFAKTPVTARFAPNETSVTVNLGVTILDDALVEANENFGIRILSPVNASLGFSTGNVTIVDNDQNGDETINGGAGSEVIQAADGDDTVNWFPGGGNDTIDGGTGHDIVTVTLSAGPYNRLEVTKNLDGTVRVRGTDGTFLDLRLQNVESLRIVGGNGAEDLDLYSLSGTHIINNTVYVSGGGGNDSIDGSLGLDKRLVADGGSGNDMLNGGAVSDSLGGGSGADSLNGGLGADLLVGGADNDTLIGGAGNDTLSGAPGNDAMSGGGGNDIYVRDAAGDVVTEAAGQGNDLVQSSVTCTLPANVERLTLIGTGHINGTGNTMNNVLTGNTGNNVLNGAAGNDTLAGGAGNDTYVRDATADVFTEAAGQGNDLVQSSVTCTLPANVERLTLTGTAHINATGNGAANILTGNAGNNVLNGGGGADTLRGMGGNDTLVWDGVDALVDGGGGTDTLRVGGHLDLWNIPNSRISNVETIDLTGGYSVLTLTAQDVVDFSTTTDTLRVLGDAGDRIDIGGTFMSLGVVGGFHSYYVAWGATVATLLVDVDITDVR